MCGVSLTFCCVRGRSACLAPTRSFVVSALCVAGTPWRLVLRGSCLNLQCARKLVSACCYCLVPASCYCLIVACHACYCLVPASVLQLSCSVMPATMPSCHACLSRPTLPATATTPSCHACPNRPTLTATATMPSCHAHLTRPTLPDVNHNVHHATCCVPGALRSPRARQSQLWPRWCMLLTLILLLRLPPAWHAHPGCPVGPPRRRPVSLAWSPNRRYLHP